MAAMSLQRWMLATLAAAVLATGTQQTSAHPGAAHDKAAHKHDEKDSPLTQEQIDKRLDRLKKRAEERKQKREQRAKDRRRALGKRLEKRLRGEKLSDDIKAELQTHAERVARLRQIRYAAAVAGDYEAVTRTDRVLARENARHERWWRSALVQKKDATP
jgi:hypothetical protein